MYRLIEHTADMGIEAHAGSRPDVLELIARGLSVLMFGDTPAAALLSKEVAVEAEDPVELLVCAMNEIVYWCDRDNLVAVGFNINHLEDTELHATITGEVFDPLRHQMQRQVKSVTYHQACLEKKPDGWYARVYVDL